MANLNVYECRRYTDPDDSWAGALIIAAHDEDEAVAIFRQRESEDDTPDVHVWDGISATGEPRVLYNDLVRYSPLK